MYSFVGLFILFLSCVTLQFCHSLLNHVSLFLSSFAPFLLFHYFLFSLSLLKPFLMSSYQKPNLLFFFPLKSPRWFIKTDKTPAYFTSQHSKEVFLLVCICGRICISVGSGVCVSDLWLRVCARLLWCKVESSKSPPVGPETAAPTHLNLFMLNSCLRIPLQS